MNFFSLGIDSHVHESITLFVQADLRPPCATAHSFVLHPDFVKYRNLRKARFLLKL